MSKQTAVEWLIEKITNIQTGTFNGFPVLSMDEIYYKAKEMEKQQIVISFNKGLSNWDNPEHYLGKEYYNETFKK